MVYHPIENYGIVGDLHTAALVGMTGSIDFMCFPNFDSPSIFAAMLDVKKGGRFDISPTAKNPKLKQFYLPDTNILLTRFYCEGSVAEISDFMVLNEEESPGVLVRRIKVVRGSTEIKIHCEPAFDYARVGHKIERRGNDIIFTPEKEGHPVLRLRSEFPLNKSGSAASGKFVLEAGESASFILEEVKESASNNPDFVSEAFKHTMTYWRNWINRSNYRGRWRATVNRSALTLKLLTSREHGSIIASPTFGLPEEIGGVRNWDYRYTWIRDSSFTLYALIRLGYTDEAGAFMNWIEKRCNELNPDGSLQIMYGIDGRHKLPEENLTHLEGYRGSFPVRIGNGAYDQRQLDIYGELMDSVYLYNKFGDPISIDLWLNLTKLINWVSKNWESEDEGIWEIRGGQHQFLYSRLMCWVALDRGIRLATKRSFPAPLIEWGRERNKIYADILKNFWNEKTQTFVQTFRGEALDASSLLMPLMKFIGPKDPRWLSTLNKITDELVDDSLVYRYHTHHAASDGLAGREGTFNMCSFWYVECLSRSGDLHQARFVFEKMLEYSNHLKLYSEELDASGEHLGNFPQAFTHLGLISAAFDLDRRLTDAGIS